MSGYARIDPFDPVRSLRERANPTYGPNPSFRNCMEFWPIERAKSAGRLKITGWEQRTLVMEGAAAM
jgi:hypothetical protein